VAAAVAAAILLAPELAQAAGELDPSFGSGGKVTTNFGNPNDGATSVAVDSLGRMVAVGYSNNSHSFSTGITRYNPNGSLDSSFGNGGRVRISSDVLYAPFSLAVDAKDRIVVAGEVCGDTHCNFALARYRPNGTLDPSFSGDGRVTTNIGGNGWATCVAIDPQGRIVAAGGKGRHIGYVAVARYHPNGSLDHSFSEDGRCFRTSCAPGHSETWRSTEPGVSSPPATAEDGSRATLHSPATR
jgi:uncharacterized delta-60 repeat protein